MAKRYYWTVWESPQVSYVVKAYSARGARLQAWKYAKRRGLRKADFLSNTKVDRNRLVPSWDR